MNLFDLINRGDRCVSIQGPPPVTGNIQTPFGRYRTVTLAAQTRLRIVDAHELTVLSVMPDRTGWSVLGDGVEVSALNVTMSVKQPAVVPADVRLTRKDPEHRMHEIEFRWPMPAARVRAYDLELSVVGTQALTLNVGPLVNMRHSLLPLARGVGVEVGPGLRPQVVPGDDVDVTYIEQEDPHHWLDLYNKTGPKPALPPDDILARYVRASAVALDGFAPDSLDFVYSSHVFEHLPNPLQVLRNWLHVLRPGGVVLGVIPDPRYTFDCRQPPTTTMEAVQEEAAGGHEIGADKYARWCRYTEPRHNLEDLIRRKYSIHVNFFTPESLRSTAALLQERGLVEHVFVTTAVNHKDFGFALFKAAGAS